MNRDHLLLQNTSLSVTVRPREGGRVSSLRSLQTGLEFLTQAQRNISSKPPSMDASFRDGPCSGIEECLPTVGISGAETQGGPAPDHGDFWQLAWEVDSASATEARLHADGFSRTLRFTKQLILEDTSGEHHRIHCPALAELSGRMRHAGGDTALEGACYFPIGATVETIPNDRFEKWAEVEL